MVKHELLGLDELPRPGTVVAIDAEFVSMQQVYHYVVQLYQFFLTFCSGRI